MWIPNTITEWIDERIQFVENILSSNKEITIENKKMISQCTITLENFKYCNKLYLELLQDLNNSDVKIRFRNIANKLIFDIVYELDKQEYKCFAVHGFLFPKKEKDILTQESIDNITKIRTALKNIFHKVQQLCGVEGDFQPTS